LLYHKFIVISSYSPHLINLGDLRREGEWRIYLSQNASAEDADETTEYERE
jgi:hypothetical protein